MAVFDLSTVSSILNTTSKKLNAIVQPDVKYQSFKKFVTTRDMNDRQTVLAGITGLGMGSIVSDGGIPIADSPIAGFQKTFTVIEVRQDARTSFQTMYFMFKVGSQSQIIKGLGADLKKKILDVKSSVEKTKDYLFQSLLQQGFNTSFVFTPIGQSQTYVVNTTTADGIEYWSLAHLREDGGTNYSTVVVDGSTNSPSLSFASWIAANRNQALKKDGRGLPLMSKLDTIVVRDGSSAYYEAVRIKRDIEAGRYPAATPGVSGSFQEAVNIHSFEIIALPSYQGTGLDGISWGAFDSTMNGEFNDCGFLYMEAMPTDLIDLPMQLNYDSIMSAVSIFAVGANDLRNWMWSAGDNSTT